MQLVDRTIAHGKVRQVAPVLDESTRIGVAYVELDRDPDASTTGARAGMYGTGTITLGQRAALTLPSDAIVLRDGHEYVFVLGADGRVALTKVDVGRRFGNGVEISAGLDADATGGRGGRRVPERRRRGARRRPPRRCNRREQT